MPNIKHAFASAKADGADPTQVQPSHWNAEHVVEQYLDFPSGPTDPAAPVGAVRLYAKDIAGRRMPKYIGPSGVDTPLQAHIGFNNIRRVSPGSAAAATTHATAISTGFTSTATTFTVPTIATGTLLSRTRRWTQATNATAGQIATHRSTLVECSMETGFFFTTRFYLLTTVAGMRSFMGLTNSAAAATNIDPMSATAVTIAHMGMAINVNTGNWFFTSNTAASIPVKVDLGAGFPVNTTDLLELVMFAAPNATSITYRVTNLTTNATVTATVATALPAATQMLAVQQWATNNATAAIVAFGCTGWYLETDY